VSRESVDLTPRQLGAFLQDREEINFEGFDDEGVDAGTLSGGEW
jgi:hypothetical protein